MAKVTILIGTFLFPEGEKKLSLKRGSKVVEACVEYGGFGKSETIVCRCFSGLPGRIIGEAEGCVP